jgi:hypothetical protein
MIFPAACQQAHRVTGRAKFAREPFRFILFRLTAALMLVAAVAAGGCNNNTESAARYSAASQTDCLPPLKLLDQ